MMHRLLRIAVLLDVVVAVLAGALFAGMVGSWFPLGAEGAVQVTSAHNANVAVLGTVARDHHVVAAKLLSDSADANGADVLLIAGTHEHDARSVSSAPKPGETARGYVFGDRIVVREADTLTAPTGRWIVYGDAGDVRAFSASLRVKGLKTDSPEIASARYLLEQFMQTPLVVLPLFVFCLTLAAGLVASSAMMKRRAIQSFHGMPRAMAVARELGDDWLAEGIGMAMAVILWIIGSGAAWGFAPNRLPFLIVVVTSAGSLTVMLLASLLAVLMVAVLVPRVLDQVRGKRPLRAIMTVSVVALLACAVGASSTSAIAMGAINQASAAHHAAALAAEAPNAYALSFWNMANEETSRYMSRWRSFTDDLDRQGRLELIDYEPQCMLDQLDGRTPEASRPCLTVNPAAARQLGIPYDRAAEDKAQLLLPASMQEERPRLTDALGRLVNVEYDLADRIDGIHLTDTTIAAGNLGSAGSLSDDLTVRLYTPSAIQNNATQLRGTMIIVMPGTAISPSNRLSYASQGSILFAAQSAKQLADWLQTYDLTGLVASAQNTVEQARSQAAQARQAILEYGLMALTTIMGLAIVAATLGDGYCQRQRQRLFVQYIHGADFMRRYGWHILATLVCLIAGILAAQPWQSSGQWPLPAVLIMLAGMAATIITLIIWDRRMRADTIKQS
ncbi:hypothetical protein CPA40_10555 [Bifidobacterium callitrichos]|uniref:ABC transporter permease n=1 Tax=Bifidobacterium callitrichos TaxID=762209 RepID=A0A2T3G7Q9_9BIFI|nr:hypothetical protein [Bifidobacterium callitrichos]PST45540.1 hypothetical protein CPA40_10555 [Bifidobacterium callitrichos]